MFEELYIAIGVVTFVFLWLKKMYPRDCVAPVRRQSASSLTKTLMEVDPVPLQPDDDSLSDMSMDDDMSIDEQIIDRYYCK